MPTYPITPFHSGTVTLGPGILFVAPTGTTAPTGIHGGPDATKTPGVNGTAFATGWTTVGYTTDGSEFDYTPTASDVEAAESLIPLRTMLTKTVYSVKFEMAELNAQNVQLALNAGAGTIATPADPTIHVQIALPTPGLEPRVMLAWDRADGLERFIWYQVVQTGALKVMRKKAPQISTLPVEFQVEVPASGTPFDWRLSKTIITS